jgi:hypothetical protein
MIARHRALLLVALWPSWLLRPRRPAAAADSCSREQQEDSRAQVSSVKRRTAKRDMNDTISSNSSRIQLQDKQAPSRTGGYMPYSPATAALPRHLFIHPVGVSVPGEAV